MKQLLSFLLLTAICLNGVAQEKRVVLNGIIYDENMKEPIPGVIVKNKYSENETFSDINGAFSLSLLSPKNDTIVIRSVGLKTKELSIYDFKNQNDTLNIYMTEAEDTGPYIQYYIFPGKTIKKLNETDIKQIIRTPASQPE